MLYESIETLFPNPFSVTNISCSASTFNDETIFQSSKGMVNYMSKTFFLTENVLYEIPVHQSTTCDESDEHGGTGTKIAGAENLSESRNAFDLKIFNESSEKLFINELSFFFTLIHLNKGYILYKVTSTRGNSVYKNIKSRLEIK